MHVANIYVVQCALSQLAGAAWLYEVMDETCVVWQLHRGSCLSDSQAQAEQAVHAQKHVRIFHHCAFGQQSIWLHTFGTAPVSCGMYAFGLGAPTT